MSIRREMLQVARLAPKALGDSVGLIRDFLLSQLGEDGGFHDRSGQSDLYYTVFGLDGLLALRVEIPLPRVADYVAGFEDGAGLDFVHLCCLARCCGALRDAGAPTVPKTTARAMAGRLEVFRTQDGGYHPLAGQAHGTAYGAFLAVGAAQDLDQPLPDPLRLVQSLKLLETRDGAWTNSRDGRLEVGSTNATAAAITVLRQFALPVNDDVGGWLRARLHSQGGFRAAPDSPLPDLLSTATALHALAGLQHDLASVREPCLDFIDTLWTNAGGFHGHWGDDLLDCEYTYYGLLALGHLSV